MGLFNVPLILAWLVPAAPPVIPPVTEGTPQLYVVPAGIIVVGGALTGVTVKVISLHTDAVCAGSNGFGLTVTVTVNGEPGQFPPTEGVTV